MGNKLLKGEKRKEKKKPKDILGYPKFMSRKKTKKATQLQMQACPKKKRKITDQDIWKDSCRK
jgi:hypothetical protein